MDEQLWLGLAVVILRHRYECGVELDEIEVVLEQLLHAIAVPESVDIGSNKSRGGNR